MASSDMEELYEQQYRQVLIAERGEQYYQAFGRRDIRISERCLREIDIIKDNYPDYNEFSLGPLDAVEFTDLAWKLLGQYIANNTNLKRVDLEGCDLTDHKMELLFSELVKSSSLQTLILNGNEFGIVGLQHTVTFLRNASLVVLDLCVNNDINTAGFDLLLSALDGKSIKQLHLDRCNIGDISSLETYNLPCLRTLSLNENKIGREGCIILSRLLQKENSTLEELYLIETDIDDEGVEMIANSLKNNTKLGTLDLQRNTIKDRGCSAILKLVVDMTSIESTYNSNCTLTKCSIGDSNTSIRLKSLIWGACRLNIKSINSTPEAVGMSKVITYHLNSQTMETLCQLQGIEQPPGHIFADIEPVLLPKILALIGNEHGQSEMYKALIHTSPDLLSYIDRKALIKDTLAKVEARGTAKVAEYEQKIEALKAKLLAETTRLTAQKVDLSSRLALIDSDIKQTVVEKGSGIVESSKKRQRS